MGGLRLRKLADQTEERVALTHPVTGQRDLYLPDDARQIEAAIAEVFAGFEPTPRPFLGIKIEESPEITKVSTGWVASAKAEGWVSTSPNEGEVVFRSSGPQDNPWGAPPHSFVHYDSITIHTVDGDVVYDVVENPDKWPEEKDGKAGFGGEVHHYYELRLSDVHEPEATSTKEATS